MVSMDSTEALSPSACATSAKSASVQVLRAWPKARGGWCRMARSRSRSTSPSTGAALFGRDEAAMRLATPLALKALIPFRTVCTAQRRPRAISRGRRPSALRSTICARRTAERVRGTQARLEPGALLSARLADEDGWMHAQQMRSSIHSHKRSVEDALEQIDLARPGGVDHPFQGVETSLCFSETALRHEL